MEPDAIPDVPRTIGSASRGRLSFLNLQARASLVAADVVASFPGRQRFVMAWSVDEAPAGVSGIVGLSDAVHGLRLPVRPLPAGGVDKMQRHVPYAIVDKAPDWSVGHTALVLTMKNHDLPTGDFLPRLLRHIKLVTHLFEAKGMDGYLVYAGEDYEWGYLHWTDEAAARLAFSTPDGAAGPKDSRAFQRALVTSRIALPSD